MKHLLLVLVFSLGACTTTQYKTADDKIEHLGNTPDGELGRASSGRVVIQEKQSARTALMIVQHVNENKLANLKEEHWQYVNCRKELGGDVADVPTVETLNANIVTDEKFGTDEDGHLILVIRKDYQNSFDAERAFEKELDTMFKTIHKLNLGCQYKLENKGA